MINKRRIAIVVVSIFLIGTAVLGIWNGLDDLPYATSNGQRIVSFTTCMYGIVAIVAVVGLWFNRRWSLYLVFVWALLCGFAAFNSTLFYGETTASVATISGGGTILVTAPFVWLAWWLLKS